MSANISLCVLLLYAFNSDLFSGENSKRCSVSATYVSQEIDTSNIGTEEIQIGSHATPEIDADYERIVKTDNKGPDGKIKDLQRKKRQGTSQYYYSGKPENEHNNNQLNHQNVFPYTNNHESQLIQLMRDGYARQNYPNYYQNGQLINQYYNDQMNEYNRNEYHQILHPDFLKMMSPDIFVPTQSEEKETKVYSEEEQPSEFDSLIEPKIKVIVEKNSNDKDETKSEEYHENKEYSEENSSAENKSNTGEDETDKSKESAEYEKGSEEQFSVVKKISIYDEYANKSEENSYKENESKEIQNEGHLDYAKI